MKHRFRLAAIVFVLISGSGASAETPYFQGIGYLPGALGYYTVPRHFSADGSTVVGFTGTSAGTWDVNGGAKPWRGAGGRKT